MTPIDFRVSRSKVKVTVTFKLRGAQNVSQIFLVKLGVISLLSTDVLLSAHF